MDIENFIALLNGTKKIGKSQWQARCPAHDDQNPSLSIAERDGKILLHCHAGCSTKEILDVLNIDETELFQDDDSLDSFDRDETFTSNKTSNKNSSIQKAKKNEWKTLDLKDIKAKEIPDDSQAMDYLKKRGFSEDTIHSEDLMVDDDGNIMFLFYDNEGELNFIKYREPRKIPSDYDGPKYWQEPDGTPILFRQNKVDKGEPLLVTEGQMDALAIVEAGYNNVVSIPGGASDLSFLEVTYDFLKDFDHVIVWPDQDDAGMKFLDEFTTRIGEWRCSYVESPHNDPNIHLHKEGKESILDAISNAKDLVGGVIRVSEIDGDPLNTERIKSTFRILNKVAGGYGLGEVSVITGKSGHGKSTFVLNEVVKAIDQGYPTLLYNGELTNSRVRYWSELIMAGNGNLNWVYDDNRGKEVPAVQKDIKEHLREWYYDRYLLYDTKKGDNIDEVLETFRSAVAKFGVKNFVIDNLMKLVFAAIRSSNLDRYQLQSKLVGEIVDFAEKFNVHVVLVAHPKKFDRAIKTLGDVSGHQDIVNRVDLMLAVRKLSQEVIEDDDDLGYEDDATVRVIKNRSDGPTGNRIVLNFDKNTKRYAERDGQHEYSLDRVYRWKDSYNG